MSTCKHKNKLARPCGILAVQSYEDAELPLFLRCACSETLVMRLVVQLCISASAEKWVEGKMFSRYVWVCMNATPKMFKLQWTSRKKCSIYCGSLRHNHLALLQQVVVHVIVGYC